MSEDSSCLPPSYAHSSTFLRNDDRAEAFEVAGVERENLRDAVALHRGDEASVVGPESGDPHRFDQCMPEVE